MRGHGRSPFFLRFLHSLVVKRVRRALVKLCCGGVDPVAAAWAPGHEALLVEQRAMVHAMEIDDDNKDQYVMAWDPRNVTWEQARARLRLNKAAAISVGMLRLFLWHWLQPVA